MKQIILLFVFSFGVLLSYSQVQPSKVSKIQMNYKGYRIYLLPVSHATFGYDIVQGNKIVVHQVHNPFNGLPVGLKNAEDVFKVAMWQIDHVKNSSLEESRSPNQRVAGVEKLTPGWQQRLKNMNAIHAQLIHSKVPMSVARQLHINVDAH